MTKLGFSSLREITIYWRPTLFFVWVIFFDFLNELFIRNKNDERFQIQNKRNRNDNVRRSTYLNNGPKIVTNLKGHSTQNESGV